MLLDKKVAVIYSGGPISGAVAGTFAGEGASVFLAGRGLRRQWATELGPHGIRVVTIKTGGIPETLPKGIKGRDEIITSLQEAALLPWTATLNDVGTVAAFVASDQARTITSADVNISAGAIVD